MESLFSLVEREFFQCYEFESIYNGRDVFEKYFNWLNNKRRRHAFGKMSPAEYCHIFFPCHPAEATKSLKWRICQGDDTS